MVRNNIGDTLSNILVTGGAGFIGSHIVDALVEQHQVLVLDDLSTGNINNINPKAIFINLSITQPLDDIFKQIQFDYVFHLAAQINLRHSIKEPKADAMTNIIGSLNLLENCVITKVKRIVFSSTGGAIYSPENSLPFSEESKAVPESPYGLAKLTVENYLKIFNKIHGLQSTVLRYSNVFGPRQNAKGEAGVISIFIERALRNEDLIIFGDGNQTRDFVYVDDVVQANLLALNAELDGTYNVSSNIQYSVNEVAHKIIDEITTSSKIIHADPVSGEMAHTLLSADKIIKAGWKPKWTMDKGILATINYFKDI